MKNFLLSFAFFCSLTSLPQVSLAQTSLKFIDGIELNGERSYAMTPSLVETFPAVPVKKNLGWGTSNAQLATEGCKAMQFKFAQLLDTEIEALTNTSLFTFIDEWWNTSYLYGGTTKRGIDCSALTSLLLSSVYAIALPRTAREQYAVSRKLQKEDLMEGDLVFFNTRGGVSHVGVYLRNDYFLHASVGNGVTISSLNETYYANKYIGAGRVKDEYMAGN